MLAGETILIIDDNADVRTLLGERVLPSYGYRTLTAPDGQEGLWLIRTQNPHLILLDLRLPDMTGLDLLHILSSEGYDTPVILITAYGSELIAAQALRLGIHDYIIKPFTLDEIVESVERALTENRLRHERNALNVRLQYCTHALGLLADVGAAVAQVEDLDLLLCRLLEMAVAATRAQQGRLWTGEGRGAHLYLRVAQDRPDQRAYVLNRREEVPPQIEAALAAGTVQQWAPESSEVPEAGVAIPIFLAGHSAAALELHLRAEDAHADGSHLLILHVFADWVGMVLTGSRLRHQSMALQRQIEILGASSQDMLLVLDETGTITAATPAIEAMMGQRPAEVIGQDFFQWIQGIESRPGDLAEWYSRQLGEERSSERYVCLFRGSQEEPRQAEVQIVLQQEEEGAWQRYLLFHEVTAYNRLEQRVGSLRRSLDEVVRGSRLGLFMTDLKGTVLAVNSVLPDLLQLSREALLGQPLWEAFAAAEGGHLLPEGIARSCREGSSYMEVLWPGEIGMLGITALLLQGAGGAAQAIAVLVGPAQSSTHDGA